jgi:CheY-like chemotaxis protein
MTRLVLVVDDDPHFRLFAEKALRGRGYDVETRENAFGLVNRVAGFAADGSRTRQPDLLLLDHMMPGLEGGDSLRLLAKDPRSSSVPVLLVSAGDADLLRGLAAQHPRCRFVPKTGHMKPVVDAVMELVGATAEAPVRARG